MNYKKILWTLTLTIAATDFAGAAPYPTRVERSVNAEGVEQFVLADSVGKTVYIFDPDQVGQVPACNGRCAEVWPPILLNDVEVADVVAPYGVIARATGLNQLTLNGKPLYNYYLDRIPGDILGDGVGTVWHILPQEAPAEVIE